MDDNANTTTQPAGLYAPEVADRPKRMSEGRRIGMRLMGLVLFLVGAGFVIALIALGPGGLVETWGGERCSNDLATLGPGEEECTSLFDLLEFLGGALVFILAGLVLVVLLRRPTAT